MRPQVLLNTAAMLTVLASPLPGFSAVAREAAATPLAVASSDDIRTAENTPNSKLRTALPCGWIGVRVHPMTAAFADSLGMTQPYGAIFGQPRPGGPAAQAKIEAYDVVTAINGSPLRSWRDFGPIIASMAPGTRVYLTTWRSGQLIDVRVVLGSGKCPG